MSHLICVASGKWLVAGEGENRHGRLTPARAVVLPPNSNLLFISPTIFPFNFRFVDFFTFDFVTFVGYMLPVHVKRKKDPRLWTFANRPFA
jgi:hypothetical protein